MNDFMKKNKVNRLYKYIEREFDKRKTIFGWMPATEDEFDFSVDIVFSYHSNSKFATEDDKKISKIEGRGITTRKDYEMFFKSLTGDDPDTFITKWESSDEELAAHWKRLHQKNMRDDQHIFVKNLAYLLRDGTRFIMYSRGYKIIPAEQISAL